jgi:NADH-quinone oxidoreductase subunit E
MKTELELETKSEPGLDFIDEIVKRYDGEEGMLIPMLQDIQAKYGYLPADHLRSLSKTLKVPLARIYGVATFYASFRMAPKGRHDVTLCMGTVCYLKGSPRISEAICQEYKIEPGGTTSDRLFTLQLVNCVGSCAVAPVMIVDGKYYGNLTPPKALEALRALPQADEEEGEAVREKPEAVRAVKPQAKPEAERKEKPAAAKKAQLAAKPAAGPEAKLRAKSKTPPPAKPSSAKKAQLAARPTAKTSAKPDTKQPAKTKRAAAPSGIKKEGKK